MADRFRFFIFLALIAIIFAGCAQTPPPTNAVPAATIAPETTAGTATLEAARTATPAATALPPAVEGTATPAPWRIAAHPALPDELLVAAQAIVAAHPSQFAWAEGDVADVELRLDVAGQGNALATWVFAVAVPFATVADGVTLAELQSSWRGEVGTPPLLTAATEALLRQLWGEGQATIVTAAELESTLWVQRPTWTLMPFHQLAPSLKVWAVDGLSPLSADFGANAYPLTLELTMVGDDEAVRAFTASWTGPTANREPGKITRIALTGVTALVRATAYQMETRSLTYPGEEVGPILHAADIAHVSNEVSFVPDCPPPHYIGGTTFCSSPRYMELLQFLGVDVVEMTGNHVNDWGAGYIPYTLQLYDDAGIRYFGGGRNLAQAREPAIFEHNGNTIVFLGCNPAGPAGAWAGDDWGGARPCDEQFVEQIRSYRDSGAVVIVTQQYWESYHYAPTSDQREAFGALAAAGATAVSGSQAHHVQGFSFEQGAFIHYGLGNLFFDQMDQLGTRQSFVDLYTVYDNRLLSVSLWTGLIENYARPRLMTPEERADLLQTVFQASGW